jgi:hypothetical protein
MRAWTLIRALAYCLQHTPSTLAIMIRFRYEFAVLVLIAKPSAKAQSVA